MPLKTKGHLLILIHILEQESIFGYPTLARVARLFDREHPALALANYLTLAQVIPSIIIIIVTNNI